MPTLNPDEPFFSTYLTTPCPHGPLLKFVPFSRVSNPLRCLGD
jgi:hypothetical protein